MLLFLVQVIVPIYFADRLRFWDEAIRKGASHLWPLVGYYKICNSYNRQKCDKSHNNMPLTYKGEREK